MPEAPIEEEPLVLVPDGQGRRLDATGREPDGVRRLRAGPRFVVRADVLPLERADGVGGEHPPTSGIQARSFGHCVWEVLAEPASPKRNVDIEPERLGAGREMHVEDGRLESHRDQGVRRRDRPLRVLPEHSLARTD